MKTRYRIEKIYGHHRTARTHLYFISAKYRWFGRWHRITIATSNLSYIESEFDRLVEDAETDYLDKKEKPTTIKIS